MLEMGTSTMYIISRFTLGILYNRQSTSKYIIKPLLSIIYSGILIAFSLSTSYFCIKLLIHSYQDVKKNENLKK